jgi:hypothetical protein
MTTTTPSKTPSAAHIAWADYANASVTLGTPVDVSTKFAVAFSVRLGRRSGSAFTAGWPNVRIEKSLKTSGNYWIPVASYQMQVGASIANTTLSGTVAAGDSTCVVAAATNIAAGDYLFLGHTTTVANYEIVRVKSISGTTVTFEEPCVSAHDNTAPVTDQAETVVISISTTDCQRVRAVVDNAGSGQTIAAEITIGTFDSLGTA